MRGYRVFLRGFERVSITDVVRAEKGERWTTRRNSA
jgi:hypothetical protein